MVTLLYPLLGTLSALNTNVALGAPLFRPSFVHRHGQCGILFLGREPTFHREFLLTAHNPIQKRYPHRRIRNSDFFWKKRRRKNSNQDLENPQDVETWRIYGIDIDPDSLGQSSPSNNKRNQNMTFEEMYMTKPVWKALLSRLRIQTEFQGETHDDFDIVPPPQLIHARVARRSLDARRKKGSDPKYVYVVDVELTRKNARELNFLHQPGNMELLSGGRDGAYLQGDPILGAVEKEQNNTLPKVVIVGAGPAGLFCALYLAKAGFKPIVLERGQPVEARGKSIGALIHRRTVDPESNFSFGEGGAGTWSDGKLTTRIGHNSASVRFVLETLVKYGAPESILLEGAPHLGTDNLVRLLRNMRKDLKSMGGEIHFGCRVSKIHIANGVVVSLEIESVGENLCLNTEKSSNFQHPDAVVLATGHSARDIYEELHKAGVRMEAKGFAVGFRIEHPQRIINEIQYGKDWGGRVFTNRISTDNANREHFSKFVEFNSTSHNGFVPVASYRLATNEAFDGNSTRGAYSFCMCPGGQIVPSSTIEGELCINGMSFSNRDSPWANSAIVVTVSPDDPVLDKYRSTHGDLAGLEFQRDMERRAWELGGGNFTVPVQRLTDFLDRRVSQSVPPSSYRLGVKSAACHDIYPQPLYNALVFAILHHFDKQMHGFVTNEALLHAVETRTSSPLRIIRDLNTFQASGVENLFPAGEGAGFAGGIVSAAVDGLAVADAISYKYSGKINSSMNDRSNVGICY